MSTSENGIYMYNWQGTLLSSIVDIRGNGPGECTYNNDFTIDNSTGRIYVVDAMQKEIEVYSMREKYIRTISLKEKVNGFPSDITFWNSNLVLGYSGSEEFNWTIIDTLGNLVDKKKNALYPYKCNVGLLGGFYKHGDEIKFWDPFYDTIFIISNDWKYQPEYVFKRGEQWVPSNLIDLWIFRRC